MPEESRLDRIESLIEKIGHRVDSNARDIEALTHFRYVQHDIQKTFLITIFNNYCARNNIM